MPAPVRWLSEDRTAGASANDEPWVTATPDGGFSIAYSGASTTSQTDIVALIATAAGGFDTRYQVNQFISDSALKNQPSSALTRDGRLVYAWTAEPIGGGGNLEDVYVAIYYDGAVVRAPFVLAGGAGRQHDPIVAASDSGFAIAWVDDAVADGQLQLQTFTPTGNQYIGDGGDEDGGEGVSLLAHDIWRDVALAGVGDNYALAWVDNASGDVWVRLYRPGGSALTGLIEVEPGADAALFVDVTTLADGRFVVTYEQYASNTVRGRVFEPGGSPATAAFTITDAAANLTNQQVQTAALHDGRFVAVWVAPDGVIAGQMMFADGRKDGAVFAVNADGAGSKGRPSIDVLADGRFAVAWESPGEGGLTVMYTIFDPREARLNRSASVYDDQWYGTAFNDVVYLGAGKDDFRAAGGGDLAYGEAGRDVLRGETGNDRLYGGGDGDTLYGQADNDGLFGELGADVLYGEAGADLMAGGDGADLLDGGDGNDNLQGGTGNDQLLGGAGTDVLRGGAGNDTLDGGAADDTLFAEAGVDTYTGGDGIDTLTYAGQAASRVYLDGTGTNAGSALGDTIATVENVFGGAGNDTLVGDGAVNRLEGGDGADLLVGRAGTDRLLGDAGDDRLAGGVGVDVLEGGAGADTFIFDVVPSVNGVDQSTEFLPGTDRLQIDASLYGGGLVAGGTVQFRAAATPTTAGVTGGVFLYDTDSGFLSWDADGAGAGAAIAILRLLSLPPLTAGDFVVVA